MNERILCAAIHIDDGVMYPHQPVPTGLVYCGWRHHTIFAQLLVPYGMNDERREKGLVEIQGFITTANGRFVEREEAMQIAIAAKQLLRPKKIDKLYSEDIY